MTNKRESKLLAVIMTILTAIALLAGAIGVPVLCRPFYYAHMTPLQIRLRVLLTEEQIKETYNEIMDYCLGFTDTFRLTHLPWSAAGADHFADVQKLFLLDIKIAAAAILTLAILWAAAHRRQIRPAYIKGHSPGFWAAAGLGAAFATLGILAAMDFDRFFTAFHTVFFPGKDNWIFDPQKDPVINMLPQVFFRNCAILIAVLIITACILLVLHDRRQRKYRGRETT